METPTREALEQLAAAYRLEARALRKQCAVALAQRCDVVERYLRNAADEIGELEKRSVNVLIKENAK